LRPHLSFGNKIACGGRERDGASFVLWKQHSVCQSGGREGHGSSFVLWKCIPPGCREMKQGTCGRYPAARAMGLIKPARLQPRCCPLEAGFRLEAMKGLGPHLSFGNRLRLEAMRGLGPHLSFGNRLRLEAVRGLRPHLSFGKSLRLNSVRGREGPWSLFVLWKCIPPGCREMTRGPGASFVLWKQDCVWRP
jgi:hypothetical protein